MPVTFNRTALIKAATDAVKVGDAAEVQFQKAIVEYRKDKEAENDMLPRLKALRDELTAFLKTKRQPTYADDAQRFKKAAGTDYLSNLYTSGVSDSDVRNNVASPEGWLNANTTLASYRGLIKMLEAHTEDTITANQLKLFGYNHLEPLFRQAALTSKVVDQ